MKLKKCFTGIPMPVKYLTNSPQIFIIIFLLLSQKASAGNAAVSQDTIKALSIGDKVPDITINNILNYSKTSAKISDFKGKLLILDFWATWCSPCVAMIPHMDSLQKVFAGKIQFLPVTYQPAKTVTAFLDKFQEQRKKTYQLPDATGDYIFSNLFPHTFLPHFVWIDENGIVRAITEPVYVTASNIKAMLQGQPIHAKVKADVKTIYHNDSGLFFSGVQPSPQVSRQSSWSDYIEGAGRSFHIDIERATDGHPQRLTARNFSIPELYQSAYLMEVSETIYEVRDTTKLFYHTPVASDYMDWLRVNGHCYELILGISFSGKGRQIMQQDLKNYLPKYQASIEKRTVKCLTLIRTSKKDKIHSTGGKPIADLNRFGAKITNCYPRVLISRIKFFLQNYPIPVADETNYKEKIDLDIKANLSNVKEINNALSAYDLQFVEKEATVDMLIIRDNNL